MPTRERSGLDVRRKAVENSLKVREGSMMGRRGYTGGEAISRYMISEVVDLGPSNEKGYVEGELVLLILEDSKSFV